MSASGDYREARTSLRQVTTAVADLTMKNPHMLLDCQSEYGLLHESTLKSLSCTAQLQAAPAAYEAQEHTRLSDPWKLLVSRSAANPATECAMPSRERTCKPKSSTRGDVLPPHVLQWLGALGTYAATTRMWLWQYAPQARNAARVCVHWVGASICEVESIPLLEGILLHSLPQCQVQSPLSAMMCRNAFTPVLTCCLIVFFRIYPGVCQRRISFIVSFNGFQDSPFHSVPSCRSCLWI